MANNSQHCWMLHVVSCQRANTFRTLKTHVRVSLSRVHVNQRKKHRKRRHTSVYTPCCMLLRVVWSCCAKFEPGQTFESTTPQISLNLFPALLFQHCWGHAFALHLVSKVLWVVSFPRCTACPNIVRSCRICLQTTANIDATTPIIVGPPMLGVAWSICK